MSEMTQEEINVSLFDELKEARKTIEQLQADKQLLWDAMGEMRQCYFETDHPDFVPPPEEET